MTQFYSQCGQDKFLFNRFFNKTENGFFVDVGAHDGITYNNTLVFEKEKKWSGINIEANPDVYKRLVVNRPKCSNLNIAVSEDEGDVDFIKVSGAPEMISGLAKHYDPRHEKRLDKELIRDGGKKETIKIPGKKLETILKENNISKINYLSIDVEGGEMSVIRSINFEEVFIDIIGFENNFNDKSIPIVKYLQQKNFVLLKQVEYDIFMINKRSEFLNTRI
jgi:FkbM family methyltransferase